MQTRADKYGQQEAGLNEVVTRNIASLVSHQQQEEMVRPLQDRLAQAITEFVGSFSFLTMHVLLFGTWIGLNAGIVSGLNPWDPFPFTLLTLLLSIEAILLTSFILMGQDRILRAEQSKAALDLQINLLAEHEVTRLLVLVDAIAAHLGLAVANRPDVDDLKKDVEPRTVLSELGRARSRDGVKQSAGDAAGVEARRTKPPA